jgi:P22 coat protein - gene protein 5
MPAPNSFDVNDFLAREQLRVMTNKLVISESFSTAQNKLFTQSYMGGAMGDTVRVPYPRQFLPGLANNLGYEPQTMVDRATFVKIDQISKVHFEYDVLEKALRMQDYQGALKEDIVEPAANTMAQDIEDRCAKYAYVHTPNIVGILGTNPATFDASFGASYERFINLGAGSGSRRAIIGTGIQRALTAVELALFLPDTEFNRVMKEGSLGRASTFNTFVSPSLYRHVAGTIAGAVTVSVTPAVNADLGTGITSMVLACTTGDTFKDGDVYNIAAMNEVNLMTRRQGTGAVKLREISIQGNVTGVASLATITFTPPLYGPGSPYQNVDALPIAGSALTLFPGTTTPSGKSGTQSLMLGKDAFALVGVKLKLPPTGGSVIAAQRRDPTTGLAVAYTQQFTNDEMKTRCRFDCPFGFGEFWNAQAAVRLLGA